jgi:hypothetical protein
VTGEVLILAEHCPNHGAKAACYWVEPAGEGYELPLVVTVQYRCKEGCTESKSIKPLFDSDHTVPGTPGEANCRGQTAAYVAQASKNELIGEGLRGIAGVAENTHRTVRQQQAAIVLACAQP